MNNWITWSLLLVVRLVICCIPWRQPLQQRGVGLSASSAARIAKGKLACTSSNCPSKDNPITDQCMILLIMYIYIYIYISNRSHCLSTIASNQYIVFTFARSNRSHCLSTVVSNQYISFRAEQHLYF